MITQQGKTLPRPAAVLVTAGALLAALAIGLSAWGSHALPAGREQHNVLMGCLFAFGHGAALVALAPHWHGRLAGLALWLLLVGVLLFAGSLIGNAAWGWSTAAAPRGGGLMMAGWVLLACAPWAGRRNGPAASR